MSFLSSLFERHYVLTEDNATYDSYGKVQCPECGHSWGDGDLLSFYLGNPRKMKCHNCNTKGAVEDGVALER